MSTAADPRTAELLERFTLKAFIESCLLLEEGVASMKDIDLGLTAGANITPPPFSAPINSASISCWQGSSWQRPSGARTSRHR